ncbi:hypothetical protein PGTUg99_016473 [Puccinia graminis f. sp. tritici]|nr:hypothetical protein PGTUg99_016473 [Puccinia graminis f. sp. tritici]
MEEDTLYGTNLSKGVHTEKMLASCKEPPVHQDRSNIWKDVEEVPNPMHEHKELAQNVFIIEEVCIFGLIATLFEIRTSYLQKYSGSEKDEVDQLLQSPNIPQAFHEMIQRIDYLSAKAFPQGISTRVDQKEIIREARKLRTQFILFFLGHVLGQLGMLIPEQPRIKLTDSSNEMKAISQVIHRLVRLPVKFVQRRITLSKQKTKYRDRLVFSQP